MSQGVPRHLGVSQGLFGQKWFFLMLGFLKGVFHPVREFINHFEAGQRLMRLEAHLRVSAGIKEEGCLLHGRVDVIIVGELCQGEECVPVVLSFSDEDPQVLFQFLVDPFHLSIGLQVCKAFTLQGEAHRHQGKPDRIYTGAYTKVQMSSLAKNRLKRRYTCWHHQRVMPNNYKYPGGSHNVRGE